MQVARHFVIVDPKLSNVSLKPDYTKESHSKDLEIYANVSRNKKRRAKALLGNSLYYLILSFKNIICLYFHKNCSERKVLYDFKICSQTINILK